MFKETKWKTSFHDASEDSNTEKTHAYTRSSFIKTWSLHLVS